VPDTPRHVTALISALSFGSPRPELLRTLDDAQWRDILIFGDLMHLTIPLAQRWGDHCPNWVRSRIDENIADNTRRFQIIKTTYAEIADVLRTARLEHVVLKGFTKSPDYAPEPRHRSQSDIDLFCPPQMISGARDVLSTIGYEPVYEFENMPWDHLPPLRRKTSWRWRGNAYDPEMPLSVELHHCLWDHAAARCGPEDLTAFWERRVERQLEEITFSALSPIDNLGYIALNLLRDLLRLGIVTSQVYELAWFLHANAHNEEFWTRWAETHDEELKRLESVSFLLAATWFGCDLADVVSAEIERLPVGARRWFDLPATSPSPLGWLRPSKDGLWLHTSLLASASEKRRLILRRLLPRRVRPVNVVVAEAVPNPSSSGSGTSSTTSVWHHSRHYSVYLLARAKYHLGILPSTLWHGLCWWWSARN